MTQEPLDSNASTNGGRNQDTVLAGEYVLGVLSFEARRRLEMRMAADSAFARLVTQWQDDMAAFNEDYKDERPPLTVFKSIEQRLFKPDESISSGIWNKIGFWRGLSFATSMIAIAAIGHIAMTELSSPADRNLVAELTAADNPMALRASFNPASGLLRIVPVAEQNSQKSLQLWMVPDSGNPISIGVFAPETSGELLIPAELRSHIGDGSILAVSLEPLGGSPTGLPTGPVIASGTARSL